jgi:hypothetical protein
MLNVMFCNCHDVKRRIGTHAIGGLSRTWPTLPSPYNLTSQKKNFNANSISRSGRAVELISGPSLALNVPFGLDKFE